MIMNDLERKDTFFHALGLRRLAEQEKMSRSKADTSGKDRHSKSRSKIRDRPYRRARLPNVSKSSLNPLFSDWKIAKKPKPSRNPSTTKSLKKKSDEQVNSSIVVTSTSPLEASQSNVLLLPKQSSPPKAVQSHPNIVIGQTIFQGPDGKKFILIPSSTSKQPGGGVVTLTKKQTHAPILPLSGNVKIPSSNAGAAPQRLFYLPRGQAVVGTANVNSTGLAGNVVLPRMVSVAATTVNNAAKSRDNLVANLTTSSPGGDTVLSPSQKAGTGGISSRQQASTGILQTSISPNIMHLLNMTKNVSNDTQDPSGPVSKIPAVSLLPPTSGSFSSSASRITATTVSVVPASALIPAGSVSLNAWQQTGSQPLQVIRINSPESGPVRTHVSFRAPRVTASVHTPVGASNASVPHGASLSVVPNGTPTLASAADVPKFQANSSQFGIISIVESTMANRSPSVNVTTPVSSFTKSNVISAQSRLPISAAYDGQKSVVARIDTSLDFLKDRQSDVTSNHSRGGDMKYANEEAQADGQRPVMYVEDPDRDLRNTESNSVVIMGRKRKKRTGTKGSDSVSHRRYGGPPFAPCKAPPAPNTPSSATCSLYEHTLLKMATRGFWGCEMGKLQDVFRSIRCESIDQDTVEDVTKRCYCFVKRRLLQAGRDSKSMYRYMKNYIDEFDSFLDRVYPVAVIAMLIYLPTAADYSLVTWHGIPPTGWSEYRRAVVMREVFEVIYRFWGDLGTVPDYQKEFFDCPIKSPLLVPRVFDLRQSYSDPTTCFVQKVPPIDKSSNGMKASCAGTSPDNPDSCASVAVGIESSDVTLPTHGNASQAFNGVARTSESPTAAMELNRDASIDSTDLTFSPVRKEADVASMGKAGLKTDVSEQTLENSSEGFGHGSHDFMTNKPRKIPPDNDDSHKHDTVFATEMPVPLSGIVAPDELDKACKNDVRQLGYRECLLRQCEEELMSSEQRKSNVGMADSTDVGMGSDKVTCNGKDALLYDANELGDGKSSAARNGTLDGVDNKVLNSFELPPERVGKTLKERKVITASFAESIAAACSNNASCDEVSVYTKEYTEKLNGCVEQEKSRHSSISLLEAETLIPRLSTTATKTAKELMKTGAAISSKSTTHPGAMATGGVKTARVGVVVSTSELGTTATTDSSNMKRTASLAREEEEDLTQGGARLNGSLKRNHSPSDFYMGLDGESAVNRRRTPRRLASATRFDLLDATDDVSLERDLRKAIKLSKLEKAGARKSNAAKDEHPFIDDDLEVFRKAERVPLKTSVKQLNVEVAEIGKESSGNPLMKVKKLKRSVAFEALWRQKSVEEPIVILEGRRYCLGEFLEHFPVETHCPPGGTVIRILNEDYNARDVLGYLRRGTQLVEQIGHEVLIDTTRTVKANSTILAVRKVPPGKISKLIHPELHLENYTSYLLPLGIKQPLRGRKGLAKSSKVKRKPSTSSEDVFVKSELQSPSLSRSPSQSNEYEETCASPPPQKITRFEREEVAAIDSETSARVEKEARPNKAGLCKETQTTDYNGNLSGFTSAPCKIKDVESLETALSSMLETALAGLIETNMAKSANRNVFNSVIESYEKAGNFLLNTAKMLSKLKTKALDSDDADLI